MKTKKLKRLTILLLLLPLCVAILGAGCEKNEVSKYSSGRIIEITCGGTIVQFLTDEIIGEEWNNHFSSPVLSYTNCVLVGNLSEESSEKGDTIYFNYERVESFSNSNFCDIGGLPEIKIEVSELFTK